MLGHRSKTLRLAPGFLHHRVNVRRKLSHLADETFECSCGSRTEQLDESPWRAGRTTGQRRKTCADDADFCQHRTRPADSRRPRRIVRTRCGVIASHSVGGSTSTRPTTLSGWRDAYARTTKLPKECPTSTYRSPAPTCASTRASSSTIRGKVRGDDGGSLQASPARSYAHTRVNAAISGCTNAQLSDEPAMPASEQHHRAARSGAVHVQAMTADVDQRSDRSALAARSSDPLVEHADQNKRQKNRADRDHSDESIGCWSFNAIYQQEFDRAALGFEPEPELLLKRGEDRGNCCLGTACSRTQIVRPPLAVRCRTGNPSGRCCRAPSGSTRSCRARPTSCSIDWPFPDQRASGVVHRRVHAARIRSPRLRWLTLPRRQLSLWPQLPISAIRAPAHRSAPVWTVGMHDELETIASTARASLPDCPTSPSPGHEP